MNPVHTVIFCDFDGTVARRDVGNRLFHRFSGGHSAALIPDWKAGRISSREILETEAAMFKGDEAEVRTFLDEFELNAGFVEFARLCEVNSVPLIILSDGLDLYIRHILSRHNLSHIPFRANTGRLENGGIKVDFPYPLGACGRCGNCKGERIAEYRAGIEGECRVAFIGDGLSDTCAIAQADLLFAKKDLKDYCINKNIPYYSFDTFVEVTSHLLDAEWLKQ